MNFFVRHGFINFRTKHELIELQGEALPLHRLSVACQNMQTEPDFIYCSVIARNVVVVLTKRFYSTSFVHQFAVSAWFSGFFIFTCLELRSLLICPTGYDQIYEDSYKPHGFYSFGAAEAERNLHNLWHWRLPH